MLQFHTIVCTKCGHKFTACSGGFIYMPPNMKCPKCNHTNGAIGEMLGWLSKTMGKM